VLVCGAINAVLLLLLLLLKRAPRNVTAKPYYRRRTIARDCIATTAPPRTSLATDSWSAAAALLLMYVHVIIGGFVGSKVGDRGRELQFSDRGNYACSKFQRCPKFPKNGVFSAPNVVFLKKNVPTRRKKTIFRQAKIQKGAVAVCPSIMTPLAMQWDKQRRRRHTADMRSDAHTATYWFRSSAENQLSHCRAFAIN